MLYLLHAASSDKGRSMVPTASGHSLVARRGVSGRLGSIPWSCVQQLCFGGYIPPHSSLYVSHMYVLSLWKGTLKIFCCQTCRCIPCSHGWLTGSHSLPWPGSFPRMRFPSWCGHSSSQSIGPQKQWLIRIFHGLVPQWLWLWDLVESISAGQFSSWTWVWFKKVFLIDPHECLPLVLHDLFWYFPNRCLLLNKLSA